MEVGKTALAFHSKDRLVMLEKKVSPQAKDLERVELEELEKLRKEQSDINLYLRSLTLRNRLQLCYEIMMVIDYYHRKEISIGTISAKAIMLFLTGATYKPKIVRLERLHSKC
jgi:predicted AAA+ superfamily ATPase